MVAKIFLADHSAVYSDFGGLQGKESALIRKASTGVGHDKIRKGLATCLFN